MAAQAKALARASGLSYHFDENQDNLGTDDGSNVKSRMDANSNIDTALHMRVYTRRGGWRWREWRMPRGV